jgi:hypothetical protein
MKRIFLFFIITISIFTTSFGMRREEQPMEEKYPVKSLREQSLKKFAQGLTTKNQFAKIVSKIPVDLRCDVIKELLKDRKTSVDEMVKLIDDYCNGDIVLKVYAIAILPGMDQEKKLETLFEIVIKLHNLERTTPEWGIIDSSYGAVNTGESPISIAIGMKFWNAIPFFIEMGIRPNEMDLYNVILDNKNDIARLFIQAGANVNFQISGHNALSTAIFQQNQELVKLLIDAHANLNIRTWMGVTPLMTAIINNNIESVKMLLQAGADKTLRDNMGFTALDYAQNAGNQEIIKLLQ